MQGRNVTNMNALPVKNPTPQQIIDDLIADVGIVKVTLVTFARLFKRTRPPDSTTFPGIRDQYEVKYLDDRLRADVGLPPKENHRVKVDLVFLNHPRF